MMENASFPKKTAKKNKSGSAWCAAPGCNHSRKKGWKMHCFPKNEERCRKWVQNCRRDDLRSRSSDYLNSNCYICSDHFEDNQFWNVAKKAELGLLTTAVPTIFHIPNPPPTLPTKRPLSTRSQTLQKRARSTKRKPQTEAESCLASEDIVKVERATDDGIPQPSQGSLLPPPGALTQDPACLLAPHTNHRSVTEAEPSPQCSLEESPRPEVKSEFRPSFLASLAYAHWKRVGQQHGLHEDEDIACCLLKQSDVTEAEPSPRCSLDESPRPEVKSEFRPSFLASPAYAHWKRVGQQHGLHEDEDIACCLLKHYEDTRGVVGLGLGVCRQCGRSLSVSCPRCQWTGPDLASTGGHPHHHTDLASTGGHPHHHTSAGGQALILKEEGGEREEEGGEREEDGGGEEEDGGGQSGHPSTSPGPWATPHTTQTAHSQLQRDPREVAEKREPEGSESDGWGKLETVWAETGEGDSAERPDLEEEGTDIDHEGRHDSDDDDSDEGGGGVEEESVEAAAGQTRVETEVRAQPEGGRSLGEEHAAGASQGPQSQGRLASDVCDDGDWPQPASTDPTTLPSTDPTTLPSTDLTTLPSTDPTTLPSTDLTTLPSTDLTTLPSTDLTTLPSTDPITLPAARRPFHCHQCGKTFKRAKCLKQHKVIHSDQKPYGCDLCSKAFTRKSGLQRHELKHIDPKQTNPRNTNPCVADPDLPSDSGNARKRKWGYGSFLCDLCGKGFRWKHILKNHKMIHFRDKKSFACDLCDKVFWNALGLRRHKRTHSGYKPIMCDVCGKAFWINADLMKHQKIHSERSFACDVCQAVFASLARFREHRASHAEKQKYACDMCSKSFAAARHLWAHKKVHSGVKRFACDVCGKAFHFPSVLKFHQGTHSADRPFDCEICFKSFREALALKIHKDRHAGLYNTPAKPVSVTCKVCNRVLKYSNGLRTHMMTHTDKKPYVCEVCNKAFALKANLERHKKIHTGEKPFECDVCRKSFRQKVELQTHMRTHTGEKPYMCDVCSRRFADLGTMRKHKKIHQKDP